MIDTYLAYLRDVRRMSPNTVESYARDLSQLAAFAEKTGRPVEALDRRDLEAFVRRLMTAGLAPRSVARLVACVRGFYKFIVVENKLAKNPADDLRSPRALAVAAEVPQPRGGGSSARPARCQRLRAACATRR